MRRQYTIKFPDQLIPGDIVLNPSTRSFFKVSFIDNGCGSGHLEFGEYVVIAGHTKYFSYGTIEEKQIDFWSFRDEPLIVLI